MLKKLNELYDKKSNNDVLFLGCGPSIKEINYDLYIKLKKSYDIFVINNFIYHDFIIPTFYHLELKRYDFDIVKERYIQKDELYKNVNFIIPNHRLNLADALPNHEYIYTYTHKTYRNSDNAKAKITIPIDANYPTNHDRNILIKSYDASITSMFDLFYKMDYKNIYLHGVDMNNSYYFWSDKDPRWGSPIHHWTNKQHENKDPNLPHQTVRIADFIVDFSNKWKKVINCSKTSLLYDKLEFKELESLV